MPYIFNFLGIFLGLFFVRNFEDIPFVMGLPIIFFSIFTSENAQNIKQISLMKSFLFLLPSFLMTVLLDQILRISDNIIFSSLIVGLLLAFMRLTWSILCKKLASNNPH